MIKTLLTAFLLTISLAVAPLSLAQDVSEGAVSDTSFDVNINSAEVDELDKHLEGVGKSKAQAIVDFRTKHGKFESIEALTSVKGIGNAIVDKNRDRIVL